MNVMATVFPPGADPSNPFSIAQPYTEPKTVKLWNRKKFLMFEEVRMGTNKNGKWVPQRQPCREERGGARKAP